MKKRKRLVEYTGILKNRKGITIIALVVTIIVLLILAGVSIATLTGDNGILSRAKTAGEKKQEAELEEKDRLGSYENAMDNWSIANNSREQVMVDKEEYEILKNNANYSTEERVIGTWVDGKNIYRKIISIPSGASASGTVNLVGDYSWVEHFIRADAFNSSTNAVSSVFCRSEGTTGIKLWCSESFNSAEYVILEYTKTTD